MSRSRRDVLVPARDFQNCHFRSRREMGNDLSRHAVADVTNTSALVKVLRDAHYRASSRLLIDDAIALLAYILL